MNSLAVAAVVFSSAFGAALVGMYLQQIIPKHCLEAETKDVIRLATGLIATMAALVLGLLVSGAKSSFDDESENFRQLALNIVLLDRTLVQFGEAAMPAREHLKRTLEQTIETLWPSAGANTGNLADQRITAEGNELRQALRELKASDDYEQSLKGQAMQLCTDLTHDRWRAIQPSEDSLPMVFLVVVAGWLAVLFTSFGLFSPRNKLALAALFICAASVAGAMLLIVDLDQPFDGLVRVSSAPLQDALLKLGT